MSKKKVEGCPHCATEIPKTASERLIGYGALIKQCPKCGKFYFDSRVKELAYNGITNSDRRIVRNESLSLLLIGIVLTGVFCLFMWALNDGKPHRVRGNAMVFLLILLGPLLVPLGILSMIHDIVTFKKRRVMLEKELTASNIRMRDPAYSKLVMEYVRKQKS